TAAWKGDQQGALDDFLKAEEYGPDRSDVKMNLGSIYQSLGDMDKALSRYRRAVEIDPKNPLYRFQLGMLYTVLGRDEFAAESLEKAVSLYPAYQDAVLELGAVYERLDRRKEALKSYKKAVNLKPMDSVARLRLALALLKAGENDDAESVLERAFNLVPVDKSDGIALSVSYAGVTAASGSGQKQAAEDGKSQAQEEVKNTVDKLRKNLERLPPSETANISVEVIYMPKEPLKLETAKTGESGSSLKAAFDKEKRQPQAMGLKREFSLEPASPGDRRKQIEAVAKELENALSGVPKDSQLHMALSVESRKAGSSGGGSGEGQAHEGASGAPANSNSRVAYNPRMVGNDMGLWVKGMGWVELVNEALPVLNGSSTGPAASAERELAQGLAHVILGQPEQAAKCFERAYALGSKVPASLGLAVASVILGDETAAIEYCEKALRLDPGNEIAKTNLKWLKTPSTVPK
ncbi:MAG TPA: tetratricopeptide repeat protein, partial [Elusimicrobiales bacterium]|nr:tetratricopeptide repeat protein [Elusimicrobiales bacterium]